MALSEATAWEVRTTGSDNNGGGFVTGATGTDFSQQDAAQATLTVASVVNATTSIIDVSALDFTCSAADVGNVVQVTGGTATAGFYRIVSRSGQQWTMDRAVGTAGQTVVGAMGGALLTIHKVTNGIWVTGNTVWVKAGTYVRTATTTVSGGLYYTDSARGNRLVGYNATRGDVPTGANRPLISLSTNTGITGINASGNGCRVENFIVDCNSLGTSTGFASGAYANFYNCTAQEFTSRGFNCTGPAMLYLCEATAGTSAGTAGIEVSAGGGTVVASWVHDNACPGIILGNVASGVISCIITNNTGALSDGIRCGYGQALHNNTIHGNGRDGIRFPSFEIAMSILNNVITSNTGNGINFVNGFGIASPYINFNAFRANGAALAGLSGTAGSTASGTAFPLSNVTLSADPYTNAAGNDFSLNETAGGGAACRAVGIPGSIVVGTATFNGFMDLGALQTENGAVGSGGGAVQLVNGGLVQ